MSEDIEGDEGTVNERLREIQRRKRAGVRWSMSRRTAELALRALEPGSERPRRPSSKSRRRKRHKRLL